MSFLYYVKRPVGAARHAGVLVALLAGLGLGSPAWAQLPSSQHYGSVEYVTGGFGLDESNAFKDAMSNYSLALTFASSDGKTAAYASKVQVVVRDSNDATVLNVEAQGPFLLAHLPAGEYRVFATYKSRTQSRSITVSESKTTRAVFDWPRESPAPSSSSDASSGTLPKNSDDNAEPAREFTPGSIPGVDQTAPKK